MDSKVLEEKLELAQTEIELYRMLLRRAERKIKWYKMRLKSRDREIEKLSATLEEWRSK